MVTHCTLCKDLADTQDPCKKAMDASMLFLPQCWAGGDRQIPRTSSYPSLLGKLQNNGRPCTNKESGRDQQLRSLAALTEVPGSVPSTYVVSHDFLFQEI